MSREQVFYNLYKTATILIVLTTPARIPRTNWINCKWHLAGISFRNLFSTILQRPQSMEAYDLCWGWFWKVFPGIEARSKICNPSFKTDLVLDLCELEPFSTTTYFFSLRRKVLILLRAFPPLLAFVSWCRLLATSASISTILIPLCWDRGGLLSSAALLLLRPWLTQRLMELWLKIQNTNFEIYARQQKETLHGSLFFYRHTDVHIYSSRKYKI